MRLLGPYIFSLLLIGMFGLCLGHWNRELEISVLKDWLERSPRVIERETVVRELVPVSVPHHFVTQSQQNNDVSDTQLSPDAINYMKQVAHVHVPQNNSLPDVSKTSTAHSASILRAKLLAVYPKHLVEIMRVLKGVNHADKAVRVRARLELANMRVAGPLGKYVHTLTNELLVRYCADDGKLLIYEYDASVQADINRAVELLEIECASGQGYGSIERQEFSPFARRVQSHPFNRKLMSAKGTALH